MLRPRAAFAVLALVLLAAPAVADHAYSHQYRVFGRVVDADGVPVSGAVVSLRFLKNAEPDERTLTTDCLGDYGYGVMDHFHVHELSTVAEIRALVLDPGNADRVLAEETVEADRNLRKTRLDWRLADAGTLEPCPDAEARKASTAFVYGRLWNATPEHKLEGHLVWGETPGSCASTNRTAPCQRVEVHVTTVAGARANATVWSNPYGDYFARLDLLAPFTLAEAEVAWLDRSRTAAVDPVLHTAEVDLLGGAPRAAREAPALGAAAFLVFLVLAIVLRRR